MNQILFLKNYDSNFIPLNGSILLLIILIEGKRIG